MTLEYLDNFKEKKILYWDTIFILSQIVEIQYIFLLIFTFSGFYSRDDVSIILWPADATGVTQWQVVLSAARARPNYLLRVDAVQVHLRRLGANGQLCTLITTFLVKLSLSLSLSSNRLPALLHFSAEIFDISTFSSSVLSLAFCPLYSVTMSWTAAAMIFLDPQSTSRPCTWMRPKERGGRCTLVNYFSRARKRKEEEKKNVAQIKK